MPQAASIKISETTQFDLSEKEKAKKEFCKDHDIIFNKKTPLICLSYSLTDKNKVDLIQEIMEGILEESLYLAVTAIGTKKYQDYFTLISEKYPQKVVIVNDTDNEKNALYAASDMILCTQWNEECYQDIKAAMRHGVVPLTPKNDELLDYNPNQENGNAFLQRNESYWSLFANLIRALENFRFPYDWKNIVKSVIQSS